MVIFRGEFASARSFRVPAKLCFLWVLKQTIKILATVEALRVLIELALYRLDALEGRH